MELASPTTTIIPSSDPTTAGSTEIKTFSWRVDGLSSFLDLDLPITPLEIEIGGSIGYPSKWRLQLIEEDDDAPSVDEIINELDDDYLISPNDYDNDTDEEDDPDYPDVRGIRLRFLETEATGVRLVLKCDATIKIKVGPAAEGEHDLSTITLTSTSDSGALGSFKEFLGKPVIENEEFVVHVKCTLSVAPPAKDKTKSTSSLSLSSTELELGLEDDQEVPCCSKSLLPKEEGLKNFVPFLDNGGKAEFQLQVQNDTGQKQFKTLIHTNLVGSQSRVLRKQIEAHIKGPYASSGGMLIFEYSPEAFQMMIRWMYTGELDQEWKKIPEEMVMISSKYEVTLLEEYLDLNLHRVCSLKNANDLRRVAIIAKMETAKANVTNFIKANIEEFF